jgi:hypothetical protein
MQSVGAAAPVAALPNMSARAQASRINGAKSRGPRTAHGKVRSAQNALKHGMCAQRFVVLADEDGAEYAAHEEALLAELAPEGALQTLLARRVAAAAWRLLRADRIEAELFAQQGAGDGDLGLALIRDGYGARAFQTLLRYRSGAEAGLWRALRTLKALQAEAVRAEGPAEAAPAPEPAAPRALAPAAPPIYCETSMAESPNEPERRRNPQSREPAGCADEAADRAVAMRPARGRAAGGLSRAAEPAGRGG